MRILITIRGDDVAPRFDFTSEVLIADVQQGKVTGEPRLVLLPSTSGEELCTLALRENAAVVICGAIEDTHYQYLLWKKIKLIDGIIGPARQALLLAMTDRLRPGTIFPAREKEKA